MLQEKVGRNIKKYFDAKYLDKITAEEKENITKTFTSIIYATKGLQVAISNNDSDEMDFQKERLAKLNSIVKNYRLTADIMNDAMTFNFITFTIGKALGQTLRQAIISAATGG